MSPQSELAEVARAGGRASLVTVVRAPGGAPALGSRLLVHADGRASGSLGDERLDGAAVRHADELMWAERSELRDVLGVGLFVDVVAPPPRVIVVGAVDYAGALCRLARAAGWRPYVVDPRAAFATPDRLPDAEEIVVAWPSEAFERLGGLDRSTLVVVLTHDPKLDDDALVAALASDAGYVGAMGSRRAQAERRERLLAAGVPETDLDRIAAPVGLDLGGVTAEETALSIMAEMVAVRNGREGGRLSRAGGRIHGPGG